MPKHHASCDLEQGQLCSPDNMARHHALHRFRTCSGVGGCHWVIHQMIFFDGTGNNRTLDEHYNQPNQHKPSNVAKLSRLAETFQKAWKSASPQLSDPAVHDPASYELAGKKNMQGDSGLMQIAAPIYLPGVGTPYQEDQSVWENLRDSSMMGGAFARGFNVRLDGALDGLHTRLIEIAKNLPQTSKPGKVVLHIVGFSRGATLARTFVNALLDKYPKRNAFGTPLLHDMAATLEMAPELHIQSLGLFDTVSSVGLPGKTWGGVQLDIPPQVNNCLQFVAAHEYRDYFPLSSIAGNKAQNSAEWIYPGVHSDIGGGYRAKEQGRSNDMSKVPLVEMLHFLWDNGAPIFSFDELTRYNQATRDADVDKIYRDFDYPDTVWDGVQAYLNGAGECSAVSDIGDLKTRILKHQDLYLQWRGQREGSFKQEKANYAGQAEVQADISAMDNYDWWLSQMMRYDFIGGIRTVWRPAHGNPVTRPMLPEERRWLEAWRQGQAIGNQQPATPLGVISKALFDHYVHDSVAGFGMVGAEQYMKLRGIVPDDGSHANPDAPLQDYRCKYGPKKNKEERIPEVAYAGQIDSRTIPV